MTLIRSGKLLPASFVVYMSNILFAWCGKCVTSDALHSKYSKNRYIGNSVIYHKGYWESETKHMNGFKIMRYLWV